MNFSQIQDYVKFYILDDPQGVLDRVDTWINQAMRQAEDRHNFLHMHASADFVTSAGVRKLGDLPERFKRIRGHPYRTRDDGGTLEIDATYSRSDIIRRFNNDSDNDRGNPLMLFINRETDDIEVFPYPDDNSDYGDGNYRITVPYWEYTADLVSTSDTNWWTDNFPFSLIHQATADGLLALREPETASTHIQLASSEFRRAVKRDSREQLPADLTLTPRKRVYEAGRRPRGDVR